MTVSRQPPTPSSISRSPAAPRPGKSADPGQGLGALLATYRGRQFAPQDLFVLYFPGAAGVLAPLAYGLWLTNDAYTHYGPAAAETWSRPWFWLAALALFLFTILLLFRLHQMRRFVAVHQNGLRIRLSLFSVKVLPWKELAGITTITSRETFLGIPLRTSWRATLYPVRGQPIDLHSSLKNLPELIARIKASLYPRLLSRMRARLQAGEWLAFGPLAIHTESMRLRGKTTSWKEVEAITVKSGYLVVELKNQTMQRTRISKIPNFEILLQLIQQGVNV